MLKKKKKKEEEKERKLSISEKTPVEYWYQ